MSLLKEIARDVEGIKILKDWLGDGAIPVPMEQAIERAKICGDCPKNIRTRWWNFPQYLKDKVAESIRCQIEIKRHLKMEVPNEAELGTCDVCRCNMPLKIHTPIKYLVEHQGEDKMTDFPSHCWQRIESESLKGTK